MEDRSPIRSGRHVRPAFRVPADSQYRPMAIRMVQEATTSTNVLARKGSSIPSPSFDSLKSPGIDSL